MHRFFRRFIPAPYQPGEDIPNKDRIIRYLCLIGFFGLLHPFLAHLLQIAEGSSSFRLSTAAYILQFAGITASYVLNQRGRTEEAALIFTYSLTVFIPSVIYSSSMGVHDVGMYLFGTAFLIAAIFLSRRSYLVFVLMQFGIIGLLYRLEYDAPKLSSVSPADMRSDLIDTFIINIVSAAGTYILADAMKRGIREALTAKEAFRDSDRRLRSVLDTTPSGIMLFDAQGRITYANRTACDVFGTVNDGVPREPEWSLIAVDGSLAAGDQSPFAEVQRERAALFRRTYTVRFPDGRTKVVALNAAPIVGEAGAAEGAVVSFNDITGQLKVEEELLMRREQVSGITSNLKAVIYRVELRKGRMIHPLFISEGAKELFGYTSDELMHDIRKFMGSIYRMDAEQDIQTLRRLVEDPQPFDYEYRIIDANGRVRWQKNSGTPFRMPGGSVIVDGFVLDITERKLAEQQLEMFSRAMQLSSDVAFMVDLRGFFLYVNPRFTQLYGYAPEEIVGAQSPRILQLEPNDAVTDESLWRDLRGSNVITTTFVNRTKAGLRVEVESSITPIIDRNGKLQGYLSIQRDITERRQIEEALQSAKKAESLSVLAGGAAHEFNNLLTTILGRASFHMTRTDPGSSMHAAFAKIEQAAMRAAQLTRELLAYSGRSKFEVRTVDLNDIIRQHLHTVSAAVPPEFRLDLAEPSLSVHADVQQARQLVIHLVSNAVESYSGGRPSVTIRTTLRTLTAGETEEWQRHTGTALTAGPYACLEVEDRGAGMTAEVMERMFDPFFSTKFIGRGLGLSAVLGILRGHDGGIRVRSVPGEGTAVSVILPAATPAPAPASPAETRPVTILAVDDEELNLMLLEDVAESEGMKALTAMSGAEALRLLAERPEGIDAVLLDVNIPGEACRTTMERIRTAVPSLPVILSSGVPPELVRNVDVDLAAGFLQKPFTAEQFITLVRTAVGR